MPNDTSTNGNAFLHPKKRLTHHWLSGLALLAGCYYVVEPIPVVFRVNRGEYELTLHQYKKLMASKDVTAGCREIDGKVVSAKEVWIDNFNDDRGDEHYVEVWKQTTYRRGLGFATTKDIERKKWLESDTELLSDLGRYAHTSFYSHPAFQHLTK